MWPTAASAKYFPHLSSFYFFFFFFSQKVPGECFPTASYLRALWHQNIFGGDAKPGCLIFHAHTERKRKKWRSVRGDRHCDSQLCWPWLQLFASLLSFHMAVPACGDDGCKPSVSLQPWQHVMSLILLNARIISGHRVV